VPNHLPPFWPGACRLGIHYGLLPWKESDLLGAISKCYFGARELLPDDGVALRSGIQALNTILKRLPPSQGLAKTAYAKVDGYWELEPTSKRYLIRREVFNKSFTSGHERELVLKWLIGRRWLTLGVPKTASAGSPIPKVQYDWPDGERVRSYEIRIPRKSKTPTPQ
jgi:hypothetical protein